MENSRSIILTILDDTDPKLSDSLSEEQHEQCLEYYAAVLSTRDRDEILNVFCRSNPDHLSQAVRGLVGVYEPMIRDIHASIDLSEHLDNMRAFIDDFIAVSASKSVDGAEGEGGEYQLPTVGDYVELLRRHRGSVYSWLHQASSKCPQVRDQVREWAKWTVRAFRPEDSPGNINGSSLMSRLETLFAALPVEKQEEIRGVLDQHTIYLDALEEGSSRRIEATAQDGAGSASGPGIYLASWQSILDGTAITPDAKGGARTGRDVTDRTTPGKPGMSGEVSQNGVVDAREGMAEVEEDSLRPDGGVVVEALGEGFRELLREVAMRTAGMDGAAE
ncbi:hypothetical protein IMZ48_48760 [Candidatus Bathyarchaeota archaeon]|nr:hypothetical protein [Candidatus Bathyarchaeota archaeon]